MESSNMNKKYLNGIDSLLNNAINDGAFPGCNYAICFKNNKHMNSLGYKELYPDKEVNSLNTIYDLASLTKVVSTTTLIMMLLEEGKIRLHDSVSLYLPLFKHKDITLWNLLTHTSGLPEGISGRKDNLSESDIYDKVYNMELIFKPNEHIKYSDINYILLGRIIEVIANERLDLYAKRHLYIPLEMNNTSYNPVDISSCAATEYRDDLTLKGYVKGKVHDETSYAMNGIAGHAGVFSTIEDLSHFVMMILNDGIYNGKKILSKRTIDLLFTVQVEEHIGVEKLHLARNLGWQSKDAYSSGGDLISQNSLVHTGFTGTNIFIDRTNEVGFIMLSNRVHPTRNNSLHIHTRACVANYIMASLDEIRKEVCE